MRNHLNKATYNEDFLTKIEGAFPGDFYDWKIAAIFYITVHYLDAYFESHDIIIRDHTTRRREMSGDGLFPVSSECIINYDCLYRHSISCRYNGFKTRKAFTEQQKYKFEEAKENLQVIKKFVLIDFEKDGLLD